MPERITRCVYDEVRRKMTDYFMSHPSVVAVYQFGGVSSPGISDIDLLLLVDPHSERLSELTSLGEWPLSEAHRKVFLHPPAIVPLHLVGASNHVFWYHSIRHLAGLQTRVPVVSDLPDDEKFCVLCEVVIHYYPHEFVQCLLARTLDVRVTLCRLHGLFHAESIAKQCGLKWRVPPELRRSVMALRSNLWQIPENNVKSTLRQCLARAVLSSLDLAEEVASLLPPAGVSMTYFKTPNFSCLFGELTLPRIVNLISIFKQMRMLFNVVPVPLANVAFCYFSIPCRIGRWVKKHLHGCPPKQLTFCLTRHVLSVDMFFRFFKKHGLTPGLPLGGQWGFPLTKNVLSRLKRSLRSAIGCFLSEIIPWAEP